MFLSDLSPGTDYSVVVISEARHQAQRDAWNPHDSYICKERSTIVTFRTGHPPIVPTEFSVIGGTTKSLKIAWNEPILRNLKISKYLISVAGPDNNVNNSLNLTSTHESCFSNASVISRSGKRKTQKHYTGNNNHTEITPRIYEVPADTVIYEVKNLSERTEYLITLHIITPHSDAEKVRMLYDMPSSVSTVENDIWTPYVTTTGTTAGIDPPDQLHVTKKESNSINIEWKQAKAYGMYFLSHYVVRWQEVEEEATECMSSRDKVVLLREKSSGAFSVDKNHSEAAITSLFPGTCFEMQVEACFGTENGTMDNMVCEIAQTKKVTAWTRAQPAKPRLALRSISNDEFELFWDRPLLLDLGMFIFQDVFFFSFTRVHMLSAYFFDIFLLDMKEKVNLEASSTIRRSLLGYRLEVNFEECVILSQSSTSFVYKKPRAGQSYTFMLSPVTCSTNFVKQHRAWVSDNKFLSSS